MDMKTQLKRIEHLISTPMDEDLVMMDLDNGQYYSLNGVGRMIWEYLSEPCSLQELCQKIIKQYDVPLKICESQVLAFCQSLLNKNLVSTD